MKPQTLWWAAWLLAAGCAPAAAEHAVDTPEAPTSVADADAIRVEVATLAPSEARMDLDLPGEIRGSQDALLASALGGFVEAVHVDEGDTVSKGDLLVVVDRSTRAAQYAQAEAQLDQAKSSLSRQQALGDLASAANLEQLETQVRVAEAAADLARTQLSRTMIRAPFSGVVGMVDTEVGEVANPSAPLVRLVALDPIEVEVSVSDRDVVALRDGMDATVTTAALGDIRAGTVDHISPVADLNTRSFLVKVHVPNPDHDLLPGMIARVGVERTIASASTVIPQDWIVTRRDGYGVFVVEDGKAAWRTVTLGDVVRGQVVVLDGIAADDTVVITGQQDLADGDLLLIAREGRCCTAGRATF